MVSHEQKIALRLSVNLLYGIYVILLLSTNIFSQYVKPTIEWMERYERDVKHSLDTRANAQFSFQSVITVTSPNDGESWVSGSIYTIVWTTEGDVGTYVSLEYTTGPVMPWKLIEDSAANTGTFQWLVPEDPSQGCKVRVTSLEYPSVSDITDKVFAIEPKPTITITVPNGNETWHAGTLQSITWQTVNCTGAVTLQYTSDNGVQWTTITENFPNNGIFNWTVPFAISSQCKIKIFETANSIPSDESDGVFTIAWPTITVDQPNGGETLYCNSTYPIAWYGQGLIDSVKLEYTTDNGAQWNTIVNSMANTVSYSWKVPVISFSQCKVRISDVQHTDIVDESDNVFTIALSTIVITDPPAGIELFMTEQYTIRWTTTGSVPTVTIHYSADNGVTWNEIIAGTANNNNYKWDIPKVASTQCLIRVTDAALAAVSSTSNLFTITPGTISIKSPDSSAWWIKDEKHSITWISRGYVPSIALSYSVNDGVSWIAIIDSIANTGTYTWTIPHQSSLNCRVRVTNKAYPTVSDTSEAFVIVPGAISISSPNAFSTWYKDEQRTISWNTVGAVSSVTIEHAESDNSSWIPVAANIPNTGSFLWKIPQESSDDCTILIYDTSDSLVFDISDYFSIQCRLRLLTPNGGELLQAGALYDITWQGISTVDEIKIEYTADNGLTWTEITAGTENDGSFNWTIPAIDSSQCRIRISDVSQAAIMDISDSVFSITSKPTIRVTFPNGGESLTSDSISVIAWQSTSHVTAVKIEYSINSGQSWTLIADNLANAGLYSWLVPVVKSKTCLVRITDKINPSITDESDQEFEIKGLTPIIYIPEIHHSSNSFVTVPNPASQGETVQFVLSGDTRISSIRLVLYDAVGNIIYSKKKCSGFLRAGENTLIIDQLLLNNQKWLRAGGAFVADLTVTDPFNTIKKFRTLMGIKQ